jgi:hypothetical protein
MRRLSILALGVAAALSLCPRAVHAQALPDTVKAEQIRRMLLAPGGWLLNWPDTTIGYLTGNATLTFEQRGIALMVRIQNHTVNTGCEREVTVTPAGVTFDGCLERGITLRWTPDDPVFAFRRHSGARWHTLRPN